MDNLSGTGAGKILVTLALLGGLIAYWFYDASLYAEGNNLDLTHRSFMPASCSIMADRTSETRESAQAHFWQGNVRIDYQLIGEKRISAHEIVKPQGADYAWRDDSGYGELSDVKTYRILSGIALENDWFCFPWLFVDFSKFDLPGNVTFE